MGSATGEGQKEMNRKAKIAVADDDERVRCTLSDVLITQGYTVIHAQNGIEAVQKTSKDSPDVVLLDLHMPEMNGLEVIKQLKAERSTKIIPIVIITGSDDLDLRVQALKLGADDFIVKPPHMAELSARVRSLVKVKAYNDYMRYYQTILEEEVAKRTKELKDAHEKLKRASLDTIYRLSRAAEYKDEDTSVHLQRISNYAAAIAHAIGLDNGKAEALLYAAPMHDIGKLGIPDKILLKPGKLTAEEWDIMKKHTVFGSQILEDSDSDFIKFGKTIALTHHEKWNGSGYPQGLKGKEIPIEGRITAIADVFDAVTSKRPYKEAFPEAEAFHIIEEGKGVHFDPELVDAFFQAKDQILRIKQNYTDNGKSVFFDLAQSGS